MANGNLKINPSNNWQLDITSGGKTTLETSGNFLDRNIDVVVSSAVFSNSGTTGVTYYDISDSAPVLISGDYLYIDAGYVSNQKISLAKLVPDEANIDTKGSDTMLEGTIAYDKDGNKVTGTLKTVTPLNAETYFVKGEGAEVPAGAVEAAKIPVGFIGDPYYVKQGACSEITGGDATVVKSYSGKPSLSVGASSAGENAISLTESATKPSGYYIEISGESGALSGETEVSVSAATQTHTAGWVDTATHTKSAQTQKPTVTVEGNTASKFYSIPEGGCSVTGGALTFTDGKLSANVQPTGTVDKSSDASDSTAKVAAIVTEKPTDGFYIGVVGGAAATSHIVSAKRAKVTDVHTEGYIKSGTKDVLDEQTINYTVNVQPAADSKKYIKLDEATCEAKGGNLTVVSHGQTAITPDDGLVLSATKPATGTSWKLTSSSSQATVNRANVIVSHTEGYITEDEDSVINSTDVTVSPVSKDYYVSQATYAKGLNGTQSVTALDGNATTVAANYKVTVATSGYDVAGNAAATIPVYGGAITIS